MMKKTSELEEYFSEFRWNTILPPAKADSGCKTSAFIYTDWVATGRLYKPIEEFLSYKFGPYMANTHSEASKSGTITTKMYRKAKETIKAHVNADEKDVLICCGTGMTGAMNKLQRILGLRFPEQLNRHFWIPDELRPLVFISHMEHHSNHISWLETIAEVVVIPHNEEGLIDLAALESLLSRNSRRLKIVSITACSNVTGIETPYHRIAGLAHKYGGLCFVDFACSAPYVHINMHPNEEEYLDAITFSPHKFLGGPGSTGVLIFSKKLYQNKIPDLSGGGTVDFTDPTGNRIYKKDIEEREDGGTPGIFQTLRASLAIKLKDKMGGGKMRAREEEVNTIVFKELSKIKSLTILAGEHKNRLSIFSFFLEGLHYELVVRLLNDRFGIQARGGCSCAGTYGHFLLNIDEEHSERIRKESMNGCTINRPGWVRISFHPTTMNAEVYYVCEAIRQIAREGSVWRQDYQKTATGYVLKNRSEKEVSAVEEGFDSFGEKCAGDLILEDFDFDPSMRV